MIDKNTKLLTMCSARGHPDLIMNMLKSFDETKSEGTEIVIYVWEDDPTVERYKENLKGRNVIYGKKRFMVEVLNYISTELYPDIPYYQNICDDHFYMTKGWDKMMMEPLDENKGWGISYCKGKENQHNPGSEVQSGKIVRTLGFYNWPQFRQHGIEPYIISIGEGLNLFFLIPFVIEHRSINAGWGVKDKIYKFIYSDEEMAWGHRAKLCWEINLEYYLGKIKEAMANES